jgi:hypothetical protein
VSTDADVTVRLTATQVAQVVRQASNTPGLVTLLAGVSDLRALRQAIQPLLKDPKCSHSTFRALLVLVAFPPDGSERELSDIASALDMTPSTAHRYVRTWMALGLLQQNSHSRRYRRALAEDANSGHAEDRA